MNTAFVNYLDHFTNMTESLKIPILRNKTPFEQTLPISLNVSTFDTDLLTSTRNLKDFIHQYNSRKEIFHLNKRHGTINLTTNKIFLSNNYKVDIFWSRLQLSLYWLQLWQYIYYANIRNSEH